MIKALGLPDNIFAKNPITAVLEIAETEPGAAFTSYKLALQVWVETAPYSEVYVFLTELEAPVNKAFDADFFIESKLREALTFDLPEIGGAVVQLAPGVCKRYKLQYGLKDGSSMQLLEQFFHRGTGYVKVPVAEPLELDVPYATIAYTSQAAAVADVQYFDGLSTANVNFEPYGNRMIGYNTITLAGLDNIREISIPPNVRFELYKNPPAYTEEAVVFGALLGDESLKSAGFRSVAGPGAFDEAFNEAFDIGT